MNGKIDWHFQTIEISKPLKQYLEGVFPMAGKKELVEMGKMITSLMWGMQQSLTNNPLIDVQIDIRPQAIQFGLAKMQLHSKRDGVMGVLIISPEFYVQMKIDLDKGEFSRRTGRPGIRFRNIYEAAAILGAHEFKHADIGQMKDEYYQMEHIVAVVHTLDIDPLIAMNSQPRELDSIREEARIAEMINPEYKLQYDQLIALLEDIWDKIKPLL